MKLIKNRTYIIAEIGVNHNGNIESAKKLINLAKKSGADAVKFQLFKSKNLTTKFADTTPYQIKNLKKKQKQIDLLKKLELSNNNIYNLKNYAESKNIDFICSAFDFESLDFLKKIKIKVMKVPSGEINNYPYLVKLGKLNKKIILSTGMSNFAEIENAIKILVKSGTKKRNIFILQCNTEYPTPLKDVNLRVIPELIKKFKIQVGYSDHTLGVEIPLAAISLGAIIIEKHFTISKKLKGPDHTSSLTPKEFKQMTDYIRNIEKAFGSSQKKITKSEFKNIKLVRKSIVAKTNIKKGEFFSENNITVKRPGDGLSPLNWKKVLNKKALKNFNKDQKIFI